MLVCLALAVVLIRGFVVEGYMISTGSMAPCLMGYHRRVVCPSCSFAFSRGMHYETPEMMLAAGACALPGLGRDNEFRSPPTVCPNCGLTAIDIAEVPPNEGDQLLVQKNLYQLRSPRRWEVIVFRHPQDPAQAYVKRVVGMPGETIELIDGDVLADGFLQRKPLAIQRAMRICVYDRDHQPRDTRWRPRWRTGGPDSRWVPLRDGFVHRRGADAGEDPAEVHWLTYHHWIRSGGRHRTAVDLAAWPEGLGDAATLAAGLHFAADRRQLEYQGVLDARTADRLRSASGDADWRTAVDQLETLSHESPIVDLYGYNHPGSGDDPCFVHDLLAEAVVRVGAGHGEWRLRMTDGWHVFEAVFDVASREVRLHVDQDADPIRVAAFPATSFTGETRVEMSLFDRQVLVAIDGELPFHPLPFAAENRPRQLTTRPVQLGAAGLDLQVNHLRLYRDVHYTPKHAARRSEVARLGPEEFFVLGDNSPVSIDSRAWDSPAIGQDLLIGKPFLVHLPSQQARVEVAGGSHYIRIPDFSRVRYIR